MRFSTAFALTGLGLLGVPSTSGEEQPASAYVSVPVERGTISTVVQATGVVDALFTVDVGSQLSGRIAEVDADFNDAVRAGQKIAQIDPETFAARVNEARAALKVAVATEDVQSAALERAADAVAMARTARSLAEAQAAAMRARQDEVERDLQRKLALVKTGSVAERDISQAQTQRASGAAELRAALDQVTMKDEAIATAKAEERMAQASLENARAIVEQRQAALDQARLDLERTVIRAPADGTVIKRDVNPGQTVAVSLEAKTLFRIARDLHEMEVYGKIDEADVGMLKVGQPATFSVDAFPDRTFAGRVLQIRKAPDTVQNVVTYTALISAPNPDLLLLPGMTATLRIVTSEAENTLTIPNEAVRFVPEGHGVTPGRVQDGQGNAFDRPRATVWVPGRDGRPAPVAVSLGASDDRRTEITEGPLQDGERVIVGQRSR